MFLAPKGEARVKIDGEILVIDEIYLGGDLPMVKCGSQEFYVAESSEDAGRAARERWAEMAASDPREFTCLVGEETLVRWALGQWAGPGSTQVRSLEEWLDLHLTCPEEEFASYDGDEREVTRSGYLRDELGFTPRVAYRAS